MKEIQTLQTRQKEEIAALFTRMGKPPPPSVFSPAVAMTGGRRRVKSKSHKSARSSGHPSPIHSGKNTEHQPSKHVLLICGCQPHSVLWWCVQDPQLRASMTQSPPQSQVLPRSLYPLHPCPASAAAPQVCAERFTSGELRCLMSSFC